jgi:hypothetical protein
MKTRRLYGVFIFFVFASSLLFAAGMLCPGLAYAVETGVPHAYGGPGKCETTLYAGQTLNVGMVSVWNSPVNLKIQIELSGGWLISEVHVFVGTDQDEIPMKNGNPVPGKFPFKKEFPNPVPNHTTEVHLSDDMGFNWGAPWEDQRIQNIAVHVDLVMLDEEGEVTAEEGAWAFGPNKFEGAQWGWWFDYEMAHPRRGHFIDSPVAGLSFQTGTFDGLTDESGGFDYFPGERVELAIGLVHLGNPLAGHKISPLDIFEAADTDDPRVINMARLLQSLDADASPKEGINITADVASCLVQTVGSTSLDFSDDAQIESVIQETIVCASGKGITLVAVSAEDAKVNLDKSLDSNMFRKNVSRTPDMGSAKAKLNIMGVWLPALRANGDPAYYINDNEEVVYAIPYYDADGNFIRDAEEAKPIVAIYCDEVETGAHDVFASISRDDGNTWKRKNISRMADKSSFTLANGQEYYGHCKKPVFQVKGNKILVAWTTKFAKGGKPRYSIQVCPDSDEDGTPDLCETCSGIGENEHCGPDYIYDDDYVVDDFWGVSGPQRSVDYTYQGYPEVGEVPYSAVWTCRGVIVTQADINKGGWLAGKAIGDIVWFKPERLTSGRRDANQAFLGGADGAGFAVTWQEDPKGLRPGEAKGPGPGWGGATAHHKTDIWYSYITWTDHATIDENFVAGGDPDHWVQLDEEGNEISWTNRPKALVPMSLPVRISDNDAVNSNNADMYDSDGNLVTSVSAEDIVYEPENLTRCVKFEGGKTITTPDDPDAHLADYAVLRAAPSDHLATMNCTNCHVPYGTEPHGDTPTQGAPIPLVVVDAEANVYLGGFTNSDCMSCHYGHVVPRDRVIALPGTELMDEAGKCEECESKDGIWKSEIEAYYPYEPYPFITPDLDDTKDGSHRYITEVSTENFPWLEQDLWSYENGISPDGIGLHKKINYQGAERTVAVTTDGRLLDGNTSATRPNLFLQTYTKDGTKSAWAIMAYEETKGVGLGPPDDTGSGEEPQDGTGYDPYEIFPDEGKNAIYHSFDFQNPDLVSAGTILNLPETTDEELIGEGDLVYVEEPPYSGSYLDENGEYVPIPNPDYVEGGGEVNRILDWNDDPILAYENARRPRFILQSKAAAGSSGTVLIVLYKEGEDGAGRPSDIMARRCVAGATGNPYAPDNFVPGAKNVSTVTSLVTWINLDSNPDAKGDGIKVCKWEQPIGNLDLKSGVNPYEDARAHRGGIRGDFVIMGYSITPNWAASRNAHDKYDFYIRRSFDGGQNWTTDPASTVPVVHTDIFIDPEGISGAELNEMGDDVSEATKHYEVETTYAGGGEYEPGRNVSLLKNNKTSVIEPRIVAVPGTIKVGGVPTDEDEDMQNPDVFYVAYGTATNLRDVDKTPEDLYYSFSKDKGTTMFEEEWVVNPDSEGPNAGETVTGWYRLAKGDQEQGEVQLRMTPNGERFYSVWLDEGDEGSDILFRRIMPSEFDCNVAEEVTP